MEKAEKLQITMGDFLKNAGIVGMKYMLELSDAVKGEDYGIEESNDQTIWLDRDFIDKADWTDMYFKAFIKYLGPSTVYTTALEKIERTIEKIENDSWNTEKKENKNNDDLKFINDKLLSNSYQSGFDNIKEKIKNPEVYEKLKKEKLNDKIALPQLKLRLEELRDFLVQPLCKETFSMKSIIYTYINRFWDGKCFLLRTNAKKDMRKVFEKDFSIPFRKYSQASHNKSKELCVDCGEPMDSKERVSIAFMKEMADDLSRKKSAFWNCKVDAYLCPSCAFLYALSPLGFQLIGNKFVFININQSVKALFSANDKERKLGMQTGKKENEKYPVWFAKIMNLVLEQKTKELSNVQVILRGINVKDKMLGDRYLFSIIRKDTLELLKNDKMKRFLQKLSEYPIVKIQNEYFNIYEKVILNILQYHHQYLLLNYLIQETIEQDEIPGKIFLVYCIQLQTDIMRQNKEGKIFMNRLDMRDKGYELRVELLKNKGVTTDECLRGMIYQLLNALSVKNKEKFMDIILRVYCSSKLSKNIVIPDAFINMLGNTELFQQYGYAFVLGLRGSHPTNTKEDKNISKNENTEEVIGNE